MIIIRDSDTTELEAKEILSKIGLSNKEPLLLNDSIDPLGGLKSDKVLWITSLPTGYMKYQQEFFNRHKKDIHLWLVVSLNDNLYIRAQLKNIFGY